MLSESYFEIYRRYKMWKKVLGKNLRFKKTLGSVMLVESVTGREFYPVVTLLQSGALTFSQCVNLQQAGEDYLPLPQKMKMDEILALKTILKL